MTAPARDIQNWPVYVEATLDPSNGDRFVHVLARGATIRLSAEDALSVADELIAAAGALRPRLLVLVGGDQ